MTQAKTTIKTHQPPPEHQNPQQKQKLTLAIVEDDALIRESLETYLETFLPDRANVELRVFKGASSFIRAIEAQKSSSEYLGKLDCLITDAFMPSLEAGKQVLQTAKQRFPTVRIALLSGYATDQLLPLMMSLNVGQAWVKSVPFDYQFFGQLVGQLLDPSLAFGLAGHMQPEAELTSIRVTSSAQITTCMNQFKTILEQHQIKAADEMMTCFAEALTNAIYHAPRNPQGEEKYAKWSQIDALLPEETVTVEIGADAHHVGFMVHDNFGALDARTLLYLLHRHQAGDGLMDTHGRGLYLMHSLASRLVVNVKPGQCTEFILLTQKNVQNVSVGDKPILIHVV
ncbi:MAG: ATP-binding protein [Vampirovibrionales bacterium]|nr:ATP-binding protein [Vampirovibrionales bacterium]